MTAYKCWIEYPNDKSLQLRIQRGELGEIGTSPLDLLPAMPTDSSWPAALIGWSRERGLNAIKTDLTVTVRVKKADILDFIEHVYGGSDFYFNPARMLTWKGRAYLANSLNDLRACVAQQLSERLWYELKADEY